jgi:hypothetical protein
MTVIDLGKDSGRRSDFTDSFDAKVQQKGFRAYWSRAIMCSCRLNDVSRHADPSCASCYGDGWYYVFPTEAPTLKRHQQEGFDDLPNAKATQCLVTSVEKTVEIFEHLGEWILGSCRVTTFSFHKFSYRDRFTLVDGRSEYQQVMKVPTGTRTITVGRRDPQDFLRYPALCVLHALEIQTDGTRVDHAANITVNDDGSITFDSAITPAADTLLTIVYEYHPVLIVQENVIDTRLSYVTNKKTKETPLFLPRFAIAKPDYLPSEPTGQPSNDL